MEQTKRCVSCGCEISAEYKFCPNCAGTQFYAAMMRCPACGSSVASGQYCSQCGADMTNPAATVWYTCGNCGNPVHISHPNCMRCGAVLMIPKQAPSQPWIQSQPQIQPTNHPPKPKKRKNKWLLPLVIATIVLNLGIGIGIDAYLKNEYPQLDVPTIGTQPSFSRPTLPKFPELTRPTSGADEPSQTRPTDPVATQQKPTQPKPTATKPAVTKPTQPKPTETKPTEPKPTQPKPTQTKPTEAAPTEPESNIPDTYQKNHYLSAMGDGYCETMTGDIVVIFVFVTDPTDGWTKTEKAEAEEALVEELRTLLGEAESYGVEMSLRYVVTSATVDMEFSRDEHTWQEEAMKQIGFHDGYKDQRKLEEYYDADQVPVVFVVDEPGRSYAYSYRSGKGFESVTILQKDYSSLRHEICHVFGARDMYFPQETVTAAKEYLPNGIMYGDCDGQIDALTAFTIGWLDELTDEALAFLQATNGLTDEYIEEAKKQDQLTGYGTKYYDNGYYVGYMKNGVRHGEGTYYWDSGAIYTGDWVDGEREGTGTMTFADGSVYTGKWKNSKRNGKGKQTYADGGVYDGQWKDDERHGTGTFAWADGTVYTGDWSKGERTGEGTMTWTTGDKYVGQFKNGYRHGKGTYYYPNGNEYTGDWVEGERSGKGTFTWADGSWYTGDFVKSQMTGKGERYYASYGTRYVGDFVDGKRHGYGTYYYADGTTWTGYWENDARVD